MSRLYSEAGRIVTEVLARKGGIKTLTMAKKVKHKAKMHALVSETLRYREVLEAVMSTERSGVPSEAWEAAKYRGVLLVMIYDFLIGTGLVGGGAIKRVLKSHEPALRAALAGLRTEAGGEDNELLLPKRLRRSAVAPVPRYARVNTLRCGIDAATRHLESEAGGGHTVARDEHIPNLLVLPPGSRLHDNALVKSGKLILQDKASCFPAHVLLEQPGAAKQLHRAGGPPFDVVDCCAAPGNKTSHTASILGGGRRPSAADAAAARSRLGRYVFAFDKSPQRLALLRRRMKEANAAAVRSSQRDFLAVDPHDPEWSHVRAVLLDPSCSGTGMPQHHLLDEINKSLARDEEEGDEEVEGDDLASRAAKLAEFQLKALTHAFLFPCAARLTYSTCSILATENEEVVAAALAWSRARGSVAAGGGWELAPALPSWHRRGIANDGLSVKESKSLVRVDAAKDHMNGFFVALFVRSAAPLPSKDPAAASEQDWQQQQHDARKEQKQQKRRKRAFAEAVAAAASRGQGGGGKKKKKKKRKSKGGSHKIALPFRR